MKSYADYMTAKNEIYGYLQEFIKKRNIRKVLDLGCGPGRLLKDIDGMCDATGLEKNPELLKMAKNNGYNCHQGDALNMDFEDNSFDLVVAKDLIEDCKDNVAAVKEWLRVTNRYLFISAPGPVPEFAWGDYNHVRPYTRKALRLLVEDHGMSIITLRSIKRKLPFRILAKLYFQPIDEVCIYVMCQKK